MLLARPKNKLVVATEPAILSMPRPMYAKTVGMGGNRKEMTPDKKLLKWAEQFRPLRINGREVMQSYCAYGGLSMPVKVSANTGFGSEMRAEKENFVALETGFRGMPGAVIGHIDHKIPNSHGGEDDCWNYQLLSGYYNMPPMKSDRKTLHVVAEAYRRGGTIGGRSFEPMWDLFIWNFNNYHSGKNRASDIELSCWWPWWLRKSTPPYAPYLPGYDEKRREMTCTPKESLQMEFAILAWNVLLFCKYTTEERRKAVHETFEREYHCTPEEMVKFRK